jgi:hypothetical protein
MNRAALSLVFAVVLLSGVAACAGGSTRPEGSGGDGGDSTGGSGGASGGSGGAGGGSGGAGGNAPPPQSAWSVVFVDPGIECAHAGHLAKVGDVTASEKASVVVSGDLNATVDCSVSEAGAGTFKVEGTAMRLDSGLTIVIDQITASATPQSPAKGSIAYVSAKTVDTYLSSTGVLCDFYFLPGTPEGIAAGRIWAAFQCPSVEAEGSTCSIAESYVVFENCTSS